MQDHRHTALGIGHARPVGARIVDAEGALGGGALGEYGVVVDHQEKVLAALALQRADDVVAGRGGGRAAADLGAERLQAFDQHLADRAQACLLAGSGIHRDQLFDGLEVGRLLGLGLRQQLGRLEFGGLAGQR